MVGNEHLRMEKSLKCPPRACSFTVASENQQVSSLCLDQPAMLKSVNTRDNDWKGTISARNVKMAAADASFDLCI